MTELSVLFVNYNSWRCCVDALRTLVEFAPTRADGTPMPYEVIVVDNASPQRDAEAESEVRGLIDQLGGELVMHDENGGYSKGMNLAYGRAHGDWILVSNPDVKFKRGCVDALVRAMEKDETIGAAAPVGFWDEALDGRLPPNILPTIGDLIALTVADVSSVAVRRYSRKRTREAIPIWRAERDIDLSMLSGCCFLMRRAVIEQIGLFDERFPLYYEDTDLSMRIRKAGRRMVQVADAHLVHFYNRSGQTDHTEAMRRYWDSRRKYYRKWYGPIGGFIYGCTRRLLATGWAKRRFGRPACSVRDLGRGHGKPVIELPEPCDDFVVEIALDPRFYLAGAMFGSGSTWMPSDSLFKGFGPTVYYFRVVDLTTPSQTQIGLFRYELAFPPVFEPQSPAVGRHAVATGEPVTEGVGDDQQ